jgi:two-component system CheB/CheR fusion protein
MADEPGMAFVLVQHLAPDHKSILAELIQHHTRMPVCEVVDGMEVSANRVYVIPPNCDLALTGGRLHLFTPFAPRGRRLPIDFFFRSLAQDQQDRAIGIILSGTGSDGTLGIRAIKGEGGMVMIQAPESAEYDGMPRSAGATGLVDFELEPEQMPERLIAYCKHALSGSGRTVSSLPPGEEKSLDKIFILLRNQTGHDFSQYKPSTVQRRIGRRMALQQIDTIDRYIAYAQQTPAELTALFRDLLIGVTQFFRDPEAFGLLEQQVLPKLIAEKGAAEAIRIWTPGCSTGELRVIMANRAFYRTFQNSAEEAVGRLLYELDDGQWDIPALRELLGKILPENSIFNGYEVHSVWKHLGRRTMRLNARQIVNTAGEPNMILLAIEECWESTREDGEVG